MKFSVILPVFNVEKYLKCCLDSIINQSYKDLEIICINDGSTDNSLKILEQYSLKDSRIRIINQQNQGVSAARNAGIENATGDYLSFIDPDDWIEPDMFEGLYEYIKNNKSQVLLFDYNMVDECTGEVVRNVFSKRMRKKFKINIMEKTNYSFADLKSKRLFYTDSCWDKVYSKDIFDKYNFRFPSFKTGEDTLFVLNILLNNISIDCLNKNYYNYRVRAKSATTASFYVNTLYIFSQLNYFEKLLKKTNHYNSKEFSYYKIRRIYEGDKKCLPEFYKEYRELTKENLNRQEYVIFKIIKIVSIILRNIFSIKKYMDEKPYTQFTILGFKVKVSKSRKAENELAKI